MFRSEEISRVQLYVPLEISHATVAELGHLELVHFRDLNPSVNPFQRAYVDEIRRLDELERGLRYLQNQLDRATVRVKPLPSSQPWYYTRSHTEIDDIAQHIATHTGRLEQMAQASTSLQQQFWSLTELRHVLVQTDLFFDAQDAQSIAPTSRTGTSSLAASRTGTVRASVLRTGSYLETSEDATPLLGNDDDSVDAAEAGHTSVEGTSRLQYVSGVIPRSRIPIFERIMFRALRGNLYLTHSEIPEPIRVPPTTSSGTKAAASDSASHDAGNVDDEYVDKNVFLIFAHGATVLDKIRKICESLGATLYSVDRRREGRRSEAYEIGNKLDDLEQVLQNAERARRLELVKVAESIETWAATVKQEKAIYYVMNMFKLDLQRKVLIAEGWCPTDSLQNIRYALRAVTERTGSTIQPIVTVLPPLTHTPPPTFHRTNKFTGGFQALVDAYGIAAYREVNPGLFTIISFPFLFAVMFGDVGHGFMLFLMGAAMILNERSLGKIKEETVSMIYGGRYVMLLAGFFSMFTGLIYNDVFSKTMNLFGSGYVFDSHHNTVAEGAVAVGRKIGTYAFGVDPAWNLSENKLSFLNSYKMKMAVIFGFLQMMFGIVLSMFNHVHFGRRRDIYTETLPSLILMAAIIGYLVVIIIYKWSVDWTVAAEQGRPSPPSLLNTLIMMFLEPGHVEPNVQLYPGQGPVQGILLLIAGLCIPWMLAAKPYYAWREMHRHEAGAHGIGNQYSVVSGTDELTSQSGGFGSFLEEEDEGEVVSIEEEHSFSDIIVHQVLHTIEFVLSVISYTASYLRLWALSLAHAQLSEVLWDMVLGSTFGITDPVIGSIALFIAFGAWAQFTVGILIFMEGLGAFLHALRLHWVEFNSKFYQGGGHQFVPFSFRAVLEGDASE
ncbi:ATPase V0/A0 complex [Cladochytrium replicatum]|nr:ATPase V0/A0 complex [Cladochytrium replicatum]